MDLHQTTVLMHDDLSPFHKPAPFAEHYLYRPAPANG
jgi:hypothetical protein